MHLYRQSSLIKAMLNLEGLICEPIKFSVYLDKVVIKDTFLPDLVMLSSALWE